MTSSLGQIFFFQIKLKTFHYIYITLKYLDCRLILPEICAYTQSRLINWTHIMIYLRGCRGRVRVCMVVGFTTTIAISGYHH